MIEESIIMPIIGILFTKECFCYRLVDKIQSSPLFITTIASQSESKPEGGL